MPEWILGQGRGRPDAGGTLGPNDAPRPLSPEELAAETGAALPDKEVISLLDLNADPSPASGSAASTASPRMTG